VTSESHSQWWSNRYYLCCRPPLQCAECLPTICCAPTDSTTTATTTTASSAASASAEDALNTHQKKMALRSEVFNKARTAHMKEFQARFTKELQVQRIV
jgi:hypothetical protein